MSKNHHRFSLLASSSLAALLVGAGAPAALAACYAGPFAGGYANGSAIACITVNNTSFTGTLGNAGTISPGPTGISIINNSTITGSIVDSGIINASSHGILIDSTSKIAGANTAIAITGPTFIGGISNSGTISAGGFGIQVGVAGTSAHSLPDITTFSGGISNSGTISVSGVNAVGILVQSVSDFSGGISNSGTISAAGLAGVIVSAVSNFSGGIGNSGTISAGSGILLNISAFSGGISNSGTISAAIGDGIFVSAVSNFSGGIVNSGMISAPRVGINVGGVENFSGGISNSGMISAATGNGILVTGVSTFSGVIANSGTISGSTGISVQSSAAVSVFDSGTIIGTGGTAVDLTTNAAGNSFTLGPGYSITGLVKGQGSDTFQLGGTGSGSFNLSAIGTQYTGFTTFNVVSGVWNATGTFGQSQAWNVNGGTLAGTGTFNSVNVNAGGTLSPGTPGVPGTSMTINGNLAFAPGSFYAISLSPTLHAQANVAGNATISGAGLVINAASGFYKANTVQILDAAGGVNGTFAPAITYDGSTRLVDPSLSYDANDVYLSYKASLLVLPSNAPANAQNAVGALNNFVLGGGTMPGGFQNLANLSGQALNNAANQLAGQSQGSFAPVGFTAGSQFLNLMLNPYIDGRSGFGAAAGQAPLAYAEDPATPPAANAFSALALGPRAFDPHMSFWASAYGGSGSISGNAATGAANTNGQIYGFATGVDYLAMPNTTFGLALGGGGTSWQLGQGMGNGHSGMFQAGLYGTTHIGAAYVSGAAAYSLQDVTTNRSVTLAGSDNLQGNFDANVLSARIESGYRLAYGPIAVTPYGAVQTQAMFMPSYGEYSNLGSSQFALNYTSHTFNATRTELGAWFDTDSLAGFGLPSFGLPWTAQGLKLYGRLAWSHDFDNEGQSTAFFQSLPGGGTFLVNSAKPARDGALVTTGFEYRLADGWSVLAKFDGEFSSTTAIFSGTGTLRKIW